MKQSTQSPGKGTGWSARRITLSAMLAALALIFSYIEAIFPFYTGIPGVKLGLANLVVVVALYRMSPA
ncbi:MAG: Gx transporter family protein, partial [bacterium]